MIFKIWFLMLFKPEALGEEVASALIDRRNKREKKYARARADAALRERRRVVRALLKRSKAGVDWIDVGVLMKENEEWFVGSGFEVKHYQTFVRIKTSRDGAKNGYALENLEKVVGGHRGRNPSIVDWD